MITTSCSCFEPRYLYKESHRLYQYYVDMVWVDLHYSTRVARMRPRSWVKAQVYYLMTPRVWGM